MSARPEPAKDGRVASPDIELSERVGSLSLENLAALSSGERARRLSLHRRTSSCQSILSAGTEDHLLASYASPADIVSRASSLDVTSPTEQDALEVRSPSWQEKGKTVTPSEDSFTTPPRQPIRGRPPLSTPSHDGASSSRSNLLASPDVTRVAAALGSGSPDAQIRALKKLRLDTQLCKSLAEQDRGASLLVGLVEPPKSWLPSFGCSDMQTTAAAAVGSMAKVPSARQQLAAAGGLSALVHLLNTGSSEAQGHAAQALASLAEDPDLSFQVGQAGACAPLVRMLTSATPLHSNLLSMQMAADDEEAQAHAAAALANLAATSANRLKIVEAGGIAPMVLLLSAESSRLQAAAAKCIHGLAQAPGAAQKFAEAGALHSLLPMLESKAQAAAAAAAAAAIGSVATEERQAAQAVPRLATLLASEAATVRTAAAGALASLAHKSVANKAKIAGELRSMEDVVQCLAAAEMQLRLAQRLEALAARPRDTPLLALLESALGKPGLRQLSKLAAQLSTPLSEATDAQQLAQALKAGALDEQLAIARLIGSLSAEGFSQSCILASGARCLQPLSKLLRSESPAVKARVAAGLANLASVDAEAVRRTGCESALVAAASTAEARLPVLRCLYNLSQHDGAIGTLVAAGCIPALLSSLATPSADAQCLAAETISNIALTPHLRQKIVIGGGIQPLVVLLGGREARVAAAAAAALWQLCGEREGANVVGVAPGAAAAAVKALQSTSPAVLESTAGLVAAMARTRPATEALAGEGAVEHLLPLLREGQEEVQAYVADALRRLASLEDCRLQMAGACIPTLLNLLCSPLIDAQRSAAGCLAALAESAEVRERIGQAGGVPRLVQLLKIGSTPARVAAAVALTRLAVGNTNNLREFVRAGGVAPLKQLLASGSPTARAAAQGALNSLAGSSSPPKSPPAQHTPEHEDPGTPSAVLMKRKSWRSPSMIMHHSSSSSSLAEEQTNG